MSVLDYLRGFTSSDTGMATEPQPLNQGALTASHAPYSLTSQYPGAGQFSGFSLTGSAAPPYGQPVPPTLLTPEQQMFVQSQGPPEAPPQKKGPGWDQVINQAYQVGGQLGGLAAGGPEAAAQAQQQIFTKHFGGQGPQQPIDINSIPPEMQQLLQALFSAGGFH